MIKTVYNGQDVYLIEDVPNFKRGFSVDFEAVLDSTESLTKREARRSYSNTLRSVIKFTISISGASLAKFQGALRGLKAHPVLIPFWPGASFWSARASMKITGGLKVAFKADWSQFELFEAVEPGWVAASDLVAPVVWGFIKRPDAKVIGHDSAAFTIEFTENSPAEYALSFTAGALTNGPTPAGYATAPKLIYSQDYRLSTESLNVSVSRDDLGFSRERPATFYPHEVYRGQQAQYTLSGQASVASFISWFQLVASEGSSFWAPGSIASGSLSAASLAAATALAFVDSSGIVAGDYVCTFANGSLIFAKVNTVVGNTVNLVAAFGVALSKGQPIYPLSLARIDAPKVSMKWVSTDLAITKIKWSEAKPEALLPGDETLGETIGQLKTRVILFNFFRDYGNGSVDNWYFTSFEEDIVWSGHTWKSVPFNLSDLSTSLNLEDDSCKFDFPLTDSAGVLLANNPILDEINDSAEVPLGLKVYFGDLI